MLLLSARREKPMLKHLQLLNNKERESTTDKVKFDEGKLSITDSMEVRDDRVNEAKAIMATKREQSIIEDPAMAKERLLMSVPRGKHLLNLL